MRVLLSPWPSLISHQGIQRQSEHSHPKAISWILRSLPFPWACKWRGEMLMDSSTAATVPMSMLVRKQRNVMRNARVTNLLSSLLEESWFLVISEDGKGKGSLDSEWHLVLFKLGVVGSFQHMYAGLGDLYNSSISEAAIHDAECKTLPLLCTVN